MNSAPTRVRRQLPREDIEALRDQLHARVPAPGASLPQVLRAMRVIAKMSQAEYAALCGVSPRALAQVESGRGTPSLRTLERLLKPFGYRVGVVREGPQAGG